VVIFKLCPTWKKVSDTLWTLWLEHGDKQKIPALAGNGNLDRGHPHY